jgi:GT2 family glycosyltransferase
MGDNKVTVVIPTIPERDISLLVGILHNFAYEVIVVEEGSLSHKRNVGWGLAKGDYVLFLDDDNVIIADTIGNLVEAFIDSNVGIAAAVACDVWSMRVVDGGAKRWLLSGFQHGLYIQRKRRDLPGIPYPVHEVANAFMVRRNLPFRFDEQFPMDMDEADLCLRVRKAGYKVVYVPRAVVFHDPVPVVPKFRREQSAFHMARNRVVFQKKHLKWWQFVIFMSTFFLLFVFIYTLSLVINGQSKFLKSFFKGVWRGVWESLN